MYHNAHYYFYLVFAKKRGFFCLFWLQSVFGLCEWMAINLIVNLIVLVKTFLLHFGSLYILCCKLVKQEQYSLSQSHK